MAVEAVPRGPQSPSAGTVAAPHGPKSPSATQSPRHEPKSPSAAQSPRHEPKSPPQTRSPHPRAEVALWAEVALREPVTARPRAQSHPLRPSRTGGRRRRNRAARIRAAVAPLSAGVVDHRRRTRQPPAVVAAVPRDAGASLQPPQTDGHSRPSRRRPQP